MIHPSTYAEKSLLSYFIVFGDEIHCCAKKHFISLFSSPNLSQSFLYGLLDRILESFLVRNECGDQMGKSTDVRLGHSKRTCAYDRGGGSNFCHFGAYALIE